MSCRELNPRLFAGRLHDCYAPSIPLELIAWYLVDSLIRIPLFGRSTQPKLAGIVMTHRPIAVPSYEQIVRRSSSPRDPGTLVARLRTQALQQRTKSGACDATLAKSSDHGANLQGSCER